MNNPLLSVDNVRWNRVRRRWTVILGGLLTVNASLVVIALAGYTSAPSQPVAEISEVQPPPADSDPSTATLVASETTTTQTLDARSEARSEPAREATPEPPVTNQINSVPLASVTPALETTVPASPLPTIPLVDPTAIVVANPLENGGPVSFLFDETAYTLEPGEYVSLPACEDTQILYHQGDELNDAQCDCPPGIYVFDVSASGWQLAPSGDLQANSVLSACHPAISP